MFLNNNKAAGVKSAALVSVLALTAGMAANPVSADEADGSFYPRMEVEVEVEVGGDYTYNSDDPDNEINDTYPTLGIGVGWLLTPNLSINGAFVVEPTLDPDAGDDRFFEDIGLYAEELYAQFEYRYPRVNPWFYWLRRSSGRSSQPFRHDAPFGDHILTASSRSSIIRER
jgi:hypothetical protein